MLCRISSSWFQIGSSALLPILGVVRVCSRKLNPSRLADNQVALDHTIRAAGKRDARLRAPGSGGRSETVADDDIVVSLQAEGNLAEDPAVLVVGEQALAHRAMLVADIEPNAVAVVAHKPASLQHGVAAQHQLVAAGLPPPVKAFGVVVLDQALGEQQLVGAVRAETLFARCLEKHTAGLSAVRQ